MGKVIPCGVEQLKQGFCSQDVRDICQRIAEAATRRNKGEMTDGEFEDFKSSEKKKLPGWTPMSGWAGTHRVKAEAIPNGLVMADLDHLENPVGVYESSIQPLAEEGIVRFCSFTPSTASDNSTGGLRIIFRCPEGMDVEQAQAWFYGRLTDVPEECKDKCVKDLSRISFFVPADYIIYPTDGVDGLERVFSDIELMPAEPQPSHATASSSTPAEVPAAEEKKVEERKEEKVEEYPANFKGIPYANIVSELLSALGGEPARGERNNRLYRLACHLCGVTDGDEGLLMHLMPRCGLDEAELRKLVHSACSSSGAYYQSHLVRQVLQHLDPTGEASMLKEPPMPKKLPRLPRLLLEQTPVQYAPVVVNAAFTALAVYLHNVTFDYIDGRTMEAALMHLTIGSTGSGKSCANELIRHIMAKISARDAISRERDQQWKDKEAARSAHQRGEQRPEGLVVQWVQPDMTSAALIQRLHDADGRFLFTMMDELDSLDKLKDQKYTVIKNAFDCSDWGAERVGKESVSLVGQLKYNWVASTTPGGARKFFARSLTDGALNRMNISTIPEREIGAPMPRYGSYNEKWDARLAPYIANLEAATGHVRCPQAERLAEALDREMKDIAIATDDRTFENLSFRANVIGYRKAMVLWLANGCKWEKAFEDFIRWSVHYDLYCKYLYFGEAITQAAEADNVCIGKRGPVNWLLELPHEFTVADLLQLRVRYGELPAEHKAKRQIQKWIERKKVARADEQGRFVKL